MTSNYFELRLCDWTPAIHNQGFSNNVKGCGENSPSGENENEYFLLGDGNLRKSDFDHTNLSQS